MNFGDDFFSSRRFFLKVSSTTACSLVVRDCQSKSFDDLTKEIRIGLIADLHHDLMHDGMERMDSFIKAMEARHCDATIQLGDFAYPNEKNKTIIDLFNSSSRQVLHVIGNHDTDSGHTKQHCLKIWGIPSPYYVAKVDYLNLIVLDGNEKGSPTYKGGYASYIGKTQKDWLEVQLNSLEGPCVVISHQPLAGPDEIDNAEEIRRVLSSHTDKVLLAINGHTHIDALVEIDHIQYLHVNSASYRWVGGNHQHESYSKEVHKRYPWISSTCPYKDSLFAFMRMIPAEKRIEISGRVSQWVGASPEDLSVSIGDGLRNGVEVSPRISDRVISINRN